MRKLCLLWLAAFLLWSCGDSESTTSATNVFDFENFHLTKSSSSEEESSSSEEESSSSEVQSSSSSESDEDESYNSSTEENEESSSSDQKSSSSSKKAKSSSSKSKSKSSSSSNSKTKLSSSSNSMTSSSSVEHGNPVQTSSSSICIREVSPIHFLPLTAKPNADKSEILFYGGANFHISECTADASDETDFIFTDVNLQLVHVNELGQNEQARINIQYTPPTLPAQTIDFAQMGVKISDSAKTQCGNFKLFVVLLATNDPKMHDRFVSWDSVEFVREPIYCEAEPKSSSSAAIDSVVRKVEIRQFNGLMSTSETRGYSFKEDAEVPIERAQIQVKQGRDGGLMLYGVNGHKVTKYDNSRDRTTYSDDWYSGDLPPSPVHTTDFKFTEANLTDSTYFDVDAFWIVIGPAFNKETAEDFYTITLKTMERANEEGVRPLKIIYYKK